jgi:hypothetical protein
MDNNIPADCQYRMCPWDEPDQPEQEIEVICWCCDESEEDCKCEDGFDPREVEK